MKILNELMMRSLLFPDFDIENMKFLPLNKTLVINIKGAFLDIDEGILLGHGSLFFNKWDSLSIRKLDPLTKKWIILDELSIEYLKDLCEFKVVDSTTSLCGFGKKSGNWIEWQIYNAKMHAQFH